MLLLLLLLKRQVIASMTVGKDVSALFPDVVNCMQTDNLELKKLVYLYLMNYAKSQPDMAIMAVNTFVKVSFCIQGNFLASSQRIFLFFPFLSLPLLLLLSIFLDSRFYINHFRLDHFFSFHFELVSLFLFIIPSSPFYLTDIFSLSLSFRW